jgi:hypothetical protein
VKRVLIAASMTAVFLGEGHDAIAEDHVDAGAPERIMMIGIDKRIDVPLDDWADFAGVGLGVLARLEYTLPETCSSPRRASTWIRDSCSRSVTAFT